MNENDKLIQEAKHLIEQAGSFRQQAGGDASPTSMIGLWLRTADSLAAVLAVFEKARTPTDDEREALADIRYTVHGGTMLPDAVHRVGRPAATAILAAGFRRSEVPEPSGAIYDSFGTVVTRADTAFELGRQAERSETQGETSGAEDYNPDGKTITASVDWVKRNYAYRPGEDDEYVGQIIDALEAAHAALRAAWKVA